MVYGVGFRISDGTYNSLAALVFGFDRKTVYVLMK